MFVTDFLPNDESVVLLQACDILLMTYHPSTESASGAIRFCIAAKRPIITIRQDIFKEFSDCTYQIDRCTPGEISKALLDIKKDTKLIECIVDKINVQIDNTCWARVGRLTRAIYIKNDN